MITFKSIIDIIHVERLCGHVMWLRFWHNDLFVECRQVGP